MVEEPVEVAGGVPAAFADAPSGVDDVVSAGGVPPPSDAAGVAEEVPPLEGVGQVDVVAGALEVTGAGVAAGVAAGAGTEPGVAGPDALDVEAGTASVLAAEATSGVVAGAGVGLGAVTAAGAGADTASCVGGGAASAAEVAAGAEELGFGVDVGAGAVPEAGGEEST